MTTSTAGDRTPIPERQDQDAFVTARAAARTTYGTADRIRLLQTAGTVGFAVAAPLLALLWPDASKGLALAAAVWLVAGRAVLRPWQQRWHQRGVVFQEYYDTGLFGLEWNTALAEPKWRVREEIAAGHWKTVPKDRGWYEDVPVAAWPLDVLACQIQNLLWSRRNHAAYARLLWAALGCVTLAALALWAAKGLSVGAFVVQLFVPLAPALLDLAELPQQHRSAAQARIRVEDSIDQLWKLRDSGREITPADCREVQDALFALRESNPPVPTWLHERLHGSTRSANAARMEGIREDIARSAAS
ncbi:S-4TM family putative pore-forming effector [Streptomyces sp. NPDC001380]|uniref:S-4TM family putative pore-forming effector n=1 Tax=Streptomyces sp. NPDC001380 TaxID=3364566 RepID=UPI0036980C0E